MTHSVNDAPLLEVDGISAGYGQFRAVFDVSFTVGEQEVVALLGPNGAGKTSVARVVTGLIHPTNGAVRFRGVDISSTPAWQVARLGVAHAPEGRSVFATLSVEDNLVLTFRRQLGRGHVQPALDRAYELFPLLGERRRQLAGTLSGGEQRMLALARVLVEPPALLVADELSLGLAPIVAEEVFSTLQSIRASGSALLVIEQQVNRALDLADRAVLLHKGRVSAAGPSTEMTDAVSELLPEA